MPIRAFSKFLESPAAGGFLLMIATLAALMAANSPFAELYFRLLHHRVPVSWGGFHGHLNLKEFINDGLMTLFFLLMSLEVKREFLQGELASRHRAILPLIGALGGMILPALIFYGINYNRPDILPGWAIPTATDIAFSLSLVMVLRRYIAPSLKVHLTALAIIDDLGAILIIALFYTQGLRIDYFMLALLPLLSLIILNKAKVKRLTPYLIFGFLLWWAIFASAVHAVVAGVLLGLTIPLQGSAQNQTSLLEKMEHQLLPWVNLLIAPLFAFANAGLVFSEIHAELFFHPLTLGIVCGLVLGKPLGIFIPSWLAVKMKIARLPAKADFYQFFGLSLICGIGFTMSLFIGALAYTENQPEYIEIVKLGVILGSFLAALLAWLVLRRSK